MFTGKLPPGGSTWRNPLHQGLVMWALTLAGLPRTSSKLRSLLKHF